MVGDAGFEPVMPTDHSYRRELTGLDVAACRALKITARVEITKDKIKAIRNVQRLILILNAKFCSHLFIVKKAIGQAIQLERTTSRINSFDKRPKMLCIEAPNTFLMAISLVRRSVEKETRPKTPRQAIKIAKAEVYPNVAPKRLSDLYFSLK
jgi:hypothetical protein